MSLATFKHKSVVISGTNISGKGPFGFSINGNTRTNTYIGKDCIRSSAGTPMKGQYPYGYGGLYGRYPTYVMFNVYPDSALGTTSISPYNSVLTNRGMLHNRYKCIYDGTYPNTIVKNIYTGDLTDNASQGVYIDKLGPSNLCLRDVDKTNNYASSEDKCLFPSGVKYLYPGTNVGGYIKQPKGAMSSDTYVQYIKKNCSNKDTHIPKPIPLNRRC